MGGRASRIIEHHYHNTHIDTNKIITEINETIRKILQGPAEAIPQILKEAMEALKDTVSHGFDGIVQNVGDFRLFLEDTVTFFRPYFVVLLISIALYFSASAWRKFRPVPTTQVFNFSIFPPGNETRVGYREGQRVGYRGVQRVGHRASGRVGHRASERVVGQEVRRRLIEAGVDLDGGV
jgi:hypothetical protein